MDLHQDRPVRRLSHRVHDRAGRRGRVWHPRTRTRRCGGLAGGEGEHRSHRARRRDVAWRTQRRCRRQPVHDCHHGRRIARRRHSVRLRCRRLRHGRRQDVGHRHHADAAPRRQRQRRLQSGIARLPVPVAQARGSRRRLRLQLVRHDLSHRPRVLPRRAEAARALARGGVRLAGCLQPAGHRPAARRGLRPGRHDRRLHRRPPRRRGGVEVWLGPGSAHARPRDRQDQGRDRSKRHARRLRPRLERGRAGARVHASALTRRHGDHVVRRLEDRARRPAPFGLRSRHGRCDARLDAPNRRRRVGPQRLVPARRVDQGEHASLRPQRRQRPDHAVADPAARRRRRRHPLQTGRRIDDRIRPRHAEARQRRCGRHGHRRQPDHPARVDRQARRVARAEPARRRRGDREIRPGCRALPVLHRDDRVAGGQGRRHQVVHHERDHVVCAPRAWPHCAPGRRRPDRRRLARRFDRSRPDLRAERLRPLGRDPAQAVAGGGRLPRADGADGAGEPGQAHRRRGAEDLAGRPLRRRWPDHALRHGRGRLVAGDLLLLGHTHARRHLPAQGAGGARVHPRPQRGRLPRPVVHARPHDQRTGARRRSRPADYRPRAVRHGDRLQGGRLGRRRRPEREAQKRAREPRRPVSHRHPGDAPPALDRARGPAVLEHVAPAGRLLAGRPARLRRPDREDAHDRPHGAPRRPVDRDRRQRHERRHGLRDPRVLVRRLSPPAAAVVRSPRPRLQPPLRPGGRRGLRRTRRRPLSPLAAARLGSRQAQDAVGGPAARRRRLRPRLPRPAPRLGLERPARVRRPAGHAGPAALRQPSDRLRQAHRRHRRLRPLQRHFGVRRLTGLCLLGRPGGFRAAAQAHLPGAGPRRRDHLVSDDWRHQSLRLRPHVHAAVGGEGVFPRRARSLQRREVVPAGARGRRLAARGGGRHDQGQGRLEPRHDAADPRPRVVPRQPHPVGDHERPAGRRTLRERGRRRRHLARLARRRQAGGDDHAREQGRRKGELLLQRRRRSRRRRRVRCRPAALRHRDRRRQARGARRHRVGVSRRAGRQPAAHRAVVHVRARLRGHARLPDHRIDHLGDRGRHQRLDRRARWIRGRPRGPPRHRPDRQDSVPPRPRPRRPGVLYEAPPTERRAEDRHAETLRRFARREAGGAAARRWRHPRRGHRRWSGCHPDAQRRRDVGEPPPRRLGLAPRQPHGVARPNADAQRRRPRPRHLGARAQSPRRQCDRVHDVVRSGRGPRLRPHHGVLHRHRRHPGASRGRRSGRARDHGRPRPRLQGRRGRRSRARAALLLGHRQACRPRTLRHA